jgi:PPOX class probable F420-dependent enzyme
VTSTTHINSNRAAVSDRTTLSQPFARFAKQKTIVLTTYRRNGTPVPTPVHIAVDGPVAYIRTFDPSGKLKRMRHTAEVEIAPSTMRGRITGDSMRATARVLSGHEAETAAKAMAAKYPFAHGRLIPWYHRRKHLVTTEIMLTPR